MMEIALGGRPEDRAKMVCWRGCIAYLPPSVLKRQRNFPRPAFRICLAGMKGAERQTMMLHERAQHDRSILRRVVQWAGSFRHSEKLRNYNYLESWEAGRSQKCCKLGCSILDQRATCN